MTVGQYKCNQVVTPVAVVAPNEVSLLQQVNTALGSWCELLTWQTLFLCVAYLGPPEAGTHPCLQSCLRATSTLLLPVFTQASENLISTVHTVSQQSTLCLNSPHSVGWPTPLSRKQHLGSGWSKPNPLLTAHGQAPVQRRKAPATLMERILCKNC